MKCQCTDQIAKDHEIISMALDVLKEMSLQMKAGEHPESSDVRALLGFFDDFADRCHHLKEESVLFPALIHAGPSSTYDTLALIRFQHDQSRSMVEALQDASCRHDARDFASYAAHFIGMQSNHIYHEDRILPELAGQYLTAEDDAKIVSEFEEIEKEMYGLGGCDCSSTILALAARYLRRAEPVAAAGGNEDHARL